MGFKEFMGELKKKGKEGEVRYRRPKNEEELKKEAELEEELDDCDIGDEGHIALTKKIGGSFTRKITKLQEFMSEEEEDYQKGKEYSLFEKPELREKLESKIETVASDFDG